MPGEICTDNRFEIIEAAKKRLKEATNIETNATDMEALDSILYYMWQMGWLPGCKTKQRKDTTALCNRLRELSEIVREQGAEGYAEGLLEACKMIEKETNAEFVSRRAYKQNACDFCGRGKPIRAHAYLPDCGLQYGTSAEAVFCPVCGRRIKQ